MEAERTPKSTSPAATAIRRSIGGKASSTLRFRQMLVVYGRGGRGHLQCTVVLVGVLLKDLVGGTTF